MLPWRLQRHYRRLLKQLGLRDPIDLAGLAAALQRRPGGRPMVFVPFHGAPGYAGPISMLVAAAAADYVYFLADASPLQQLHGCFHELWHRACDHHPTYSWEPDHDVTAQPAAYSAWQEREAEWLASLSLARAARRARLRTAAPAPARDAALLERLEATLGRAA